MKVLFLATRCPVPPWRGDQVRALHQLRVLGRRHDVTCALLPLRPPRPDAVRALGALGVRVAVVPLGWAGAVPALARALAGDRRPLQVLLFLRARARRRIAALAADADVVHAQLVRTVPYLPPGRPAVVDLIDVLSVNFARRAALERGPARLLAALEARRLAAFEAGLLAGPARLLVVSEAERAALGGGARVTVAANGVDLEAFPYVENGRPPATLVFAGNLGYFPNVDAATWLARDVLPRIRAARPDVTLRLVGARPAAAVRGLAAIPGVSVAADVPAMAPELARGTLAVLPLRAGSGLQNKVLEAMAAGMPVVATSAALRGLEARPGEHLLTGDDAGALAAAAIALLAEPARARTLARAARALVAARYTWEASADAVEAAWRSAASP